MKAMNKNLTATGFFKTHVCDALNEALNCADRGPALTAAERYAAVMEAKSARNFWFTSYIAGMELDNAANNARAISFTPRFSQPLILTDMLSMFEQGLRPSVREFLISITQYGGEGAAYGENYFITLTAPIMTRLLIKHERNRINNLVGSGGALDISELYDKQVGFVPRLMRPYETLKIAYTETPDDTTIRQVYPHLGFRAVRVLRTDDPYTGFTAQTEKSVRDYIAGSEPETFFVEVRTTLASLGALGAMLDLRTPQLDRPVLILGAACNVEGLQARLTDELEPFQLTYQDKPNIWPAPAGRGFAFQQATYTDPPLVLWACNTNYRNVNPFCMWAVPHFVAPGNTLKISVTNGCLPQPNNFLTQTAATRNSEDVRITFLCRTV